MILKIIFDLLFFTNFHIPIDEVITALSNKNFEQIYPTTNQTAGLETKRIADTLVFKSPNQLTRDEAVAFCQRNQALLYTIESRDDLDSIFDQLQVNEVWTPIRITRTGIIVDSNTGYSPILSTNYNQIIRLPAIMNLDNVHHLTIVKKSKGDFEYKISSDQESKDLLCESNISFPHGQEAIWQLQKGTSLIRTELLMLKGLITIKKQEIISIKSTFEELDSDSQVKSDELINWNDKMLIKFRPLKEMLLETVTKWDTLSNEIQYVNLVIETRQIIEFMKNLLERVGQPFFNPKAVLQINQIPLEGINTLGLKTYFKGNNEIYVKFIITNGQSTNTTNILDKFRNWLENRSILQITILEIILSGFCLFSFLINVIDIILRVHDKIKNLRKRKHKPVVRKILRNRSLSVPDSSVSMQLRPIRKIENEKCIGCLNRNKIIYPTNLHLENSKRRVYSHKNVPSHRRASLLSLSTN